MLTNLRPTLFGFMLAGIFCSLVPAVIASGGECRHCGGSAPAGKNVCKKDECQKIEMWCQAPEPETDGGDCEERETWNSEQDMLLSGGEGECEEREEHRQETTECDQDPQPEPGELSSEEWGPYQSGCTDMGAIETKLSGIGLEGVIDIRSRPLVMPESMSLLPTTQEDSESRVRKEKERLNRALWLETVYSWVTSHAGSSMTVPQLLVQLVNSGYWIEEVKYAEVGRLLSLLRRELGAPGSKLLVVITDWQTQTEYFYLFEKNENGKISLLSNDGRCSMNRYRNCPKRVHNLPRIADRLRRYNKPECRKYLQNSQVRAFRLRQL